MSIADRRREQIFDTLARARWPIVVLILLCTSGTLGLMIIEDAHPLDALYMTVITIATVGYGEVVPLSTPGKVFAMGLIFSGAVTYAYAISVLITLIFNNKLIQHIREYHQERYVKQLSDHFILVGFTRTGREIARSMLSKEVPFVVIEDDELQVRRAQDFGCPLVLHLDRFAPDSLRRANIAQARGVMVALESDEENISVTASVRVIEEELGRDLMSISISKTLSAVDKLRAVGADYVVFQESLIGKKIAALATNPPASGYTGLLESIVVGDHPEFESREVLINEHSPLWGKTLIESELRQKYGITVVAVVDSQTRQTRVFPPPQMRFERECALVVIGSRDELHEFTREYELGGMPPDAR